MIAFLQVNVGYSLHDFQALKLDAKTVKKRQVEFIDIAMDPVENYVESEDPMKFKSQKTGRGPLEEGWQVRSSYFISIVFQQDEHYVIFEPQVFGVTTLLICGACSYHANQLCVHTSV